MKPISILYFVLSLLLSLLLSQKVLASRPYEGPISAAMGGSGRAAVIPGEIFLNPASLSYVAGYQFVANYRNFSLDPYGNITDYKFSILDNHSDNIFPAAMSYEKHRTWQNNVGTNEDAVNVAIAKTAIGRLSFGIDIERYSITPDTGSSAIEWDSSVGMIYPFTPNWGVGIVGYNLIQTNSTALIAKYAAAVAYNYEKVARMQFDLLYQGELNPDRRLIYMMGIESHLIKDAPIRIGYRLDDVDHQNYWTFGFGWNGPKVGFDYAFEKSVVLANEYAHSVDLRVYF